MKLRLGMALLAACLLAACGTRLPDSAFVASAASNNGNSSGVGAGDSSTPGDVTSDTVAGSSSGTATGSNSGGATGGGSNTGGSTNAASGANQASDVGITANTITIGNITAENGVLGDAFAPAARGMRAWTAYVNANGGIAGRKVILKTCDDREDRSRDLACAQQLVENDKVFALIGDNSRSHGGSSEYLNSKAVPVLGFPINNGYYRYPHFWSIYPNGYPRDGQTVGYKGNLEYTSGLYRWFKQTLNVSEAAVFDYDINESKQAGDGFAKGMSLEGMHVTTYTVSFAAPSFDSAVADMQRRGVQIILDAMDDGANRKLCDAMQRRGFTVKAKVSTPVSMGDNVSNNYNETCKGSVYIPGQTLPYSLTSVPEIAKFRAAYAKYQPGLPVHQWALEAWDAGQLLAQYLRAAGTAPTRKGFEDFMIKQRHNDANGTMVGMQWAYPPLNRAGQVQGYDKDHVEDCFTIAKFDTTKNDWVEATNKFPFCYPDAFQFSTPALEQGN